MLLFISRKTKTVAADDSIVMNDDAFADDGVLANRDAGMDFCFVSDNDLIVDGYVGTNPHAIANDNIISNRDMSVDENFLRNARAGIDDCGGVPVRFEICLRMKNNQSARESQIRISCAQHCQVGAWDFDAFADEYR